MTKRIDWDEVARKQKSVRRGSASAFDELPPIGSLADRIRQEKKLGKPKKRSVSAPKTSTRSTAISTPKQNRKALARLIHICKSAHWKESGVEFQRRVLAAITLALNTLLKIDPSAEGEELVTAARNFVGKHSSALQRRRGPNTALQGTLRDRAAQRP